jgi:kanamycin kinase
MPDPDRVAAGPPEREVSPPEAVRTLAGGRTTRAAWQNELGGLTFELGDGDEHHFVKWSRAGCGIDLADEADRLRWAEAYVTVPHVLALAHDDEGSWLVTAALAGTNAVAPRWHADPETAVTAIGDLEHGLELRTGVRGAPAGRVRHLAGARTHGVLPVAVGPWR